MIQHCRASPIDLAPAGSLYQSYAGTGRRVQTLVLAAQTWRLSPAKIAAEYDLTEAQGHEALTFYDAYRRDRRGHCRRGQPRCDNRKSGIDPGQLQTRTTIMRMGKMSSILGPGVHNPSALRA